MFRLPRANPHVRRVRRLLASGRLTWILLAAGTAPAATPEPPAGPFRHLTTEHGLADPRVLSLLQDREGFLWVGTGDGLGRYDGRRFRTFRHDPSDPATLGPGPTQALIEDRRGRIWAGLLGGGLSCFDPATERFQRFRHDPGRPRSLSHNDVAALLEDEKGLLWVATGAGLDRLDPDTGLVTRHVHDPGDPDSLGGNVVRSLARDPTGALWIGTADGGLNRATIAGSHGGVRFERWRHDARLPRSLPSDNVESVLVDRKGRLWVGTWGAGLSRYDVVQDAFVRPEAPAGGTATAAMLIQNLIEDHHGALWASVWGSGLVRIDPDTGQQTAYQPDPDDPGRLNHGNVWALFEDRNGLLWVATHGGGLNALDLEPQPFRTFVLRGAGVRDVRGVSQDRTGQLWLATSGGGLLRLDPSGRVIERHRHRPGDPASLADDNVLTLLEDRDGDLWAGTFKGLDRFDRVRGLFFHHRHDPARSDSLSSDVPFSLFEDGKGRLWVGTENGLNLFDGDRSFRRYRFEPAAKSQLGETVFGIAEDANGTLWVSLRGGVARLDEARGHLVRVPLRTDAAEDESPAFSIRRVSTGSVWVSQVNSLFELVPAIGGGPPRIRRHVPFPEGGVISNLESDDRGRLWLGTTQGIVRYDPLRGYARRYDASEGALGGGFYAGSSAAFRTAGGEIYFGATGGLTLVRPQHLRDDRAPPAVALTDLQVGGRGIAVGSALLPRALSRMDEIRLPYRERQWSIGFAVLDLRSAGQIRSRYRLEGFDAAWQELPPDRHEVTYTNLSPGRYQLRVVAANADGVWSETGASLGLRVLPPYWGTWWFRLLAAAAVAAALLGAHRARTFAVQAHNRRLEREVRQLRLIADSLPVLIGYVDASRRCVFCNLTYETWFGRPRTDVEGKHLEELLPTDLLAAVSAPLPRALGGEGGTQELEVGAPGKKRRLLVTLVPHADRDGAFPGVYVLAQDITERVRTEEAFRRQQEELAHAARVLTLGELAAAIAHEVNQPLTAILVTAQAALRLKSRSNPTPDDVTSALSNIAAGAKRAGEIVWKLQDLVRKGPSKLEDLDVNASILSLQPLFHAGAVEAAVKVELELDPHLGRPKGDAIQIQQVVLNLARNAFDAMKAVPLGARRLYIRSFPGDGAVVVEVRDTGPPVGDEAFERLFSPFFSTKPEGLGMGLSICRSILEAHGGEIAGERNAAGGLTVRFWLPVARPDAAVAL